MVLEHLLAVWTTRARTPLSWSRSACTWTILSAICWSKITGLHDLHLPAICQKRPSHSARRQAIFISVAPATSCTLSASRARYWREFRRSMGCTGLCRPVPARDPVSEGGNLIKWSWFRSYDNKQPAWGDAGDRIIVSWDTAMSSKELSSYSACVVLQVRGQTAYVLDVVRERLEYPDLRRKVAELHRRWRNACTRCELVIREQGFGHVLTIQIKDGRAGRREAGYTRPLHGGDDRARRRRQIHLARARRRGAQDPDRQVRVLDGDSRTAQAGRYARIA